GEEAARVGGGRHVVPGDGPGERRGRHPDDLVGAKPVVVAEPDARPLEAHLETERRQDGERAEEARAGGVAPQRPIGQPEIGERAEPLHRAGEPVGEAARARVAIQRGAGRVGRDRRREKRHARRRRVCDARPPGERARRLQHASIMSAFEIFGSIFGFISIWLTVRASVWCWPTGIVNIVLLLVTYFEARLYGDVVNYLVI